MPNHECTSWRRAKWRHRSRIAGWRAPTALSSTATGSSWGRMPMDEGRLLRVEADGRVTKLLDAAVARASAQKPEHGADATCTEFPEYRKSGRGQGEEFRAGATRASPSALGRSLSSWRQRMFAVCRISALAWAVNSHTFRSTAQTATVNTRRRRRNCAGPRRPGLPTHSRLALPRCGRRSIATDSTARQTRPGLWV